MSDLNEGINVDELLQYRDIVKKDASQPDRSPTVIAHWAGGGRSRVEFGDIVMHMGGETELNPMQMLLATFAACDVDLISMHASFLGLKIETLSAEANGHFNVQSYLGLEDKPGSGYDGITYTVRISVPEATPEQIEYLRERCERSSPVGDSLTRPIELKQEFEANAEG